MDSKKIYKIMKEGCPDCIESGQIASSIAKSIKHSDKHHKLGSNIHLVIAMEEMAELQQEVSKLIRYISSTGAIPVKSHAELGDYSYYDLIQEMADVEISLEYIRQIAEVSRTDIEECKRIKMTRLMNRIKMTRLMNRIKKEDI